MVQPAFDIGKSELKDFPADNELLIEVSNQSLNYILFNRQPHRLFMLRQYRLYTDGQRSARDLLDEIISEDGVLLNYAGRAIVVYNFPCAHLVPQQLADASLDLPITRLLNGDVDSDMLFHEKVKGWPIDTVYAVAREIHALFRDRFHGSSYWHLYTMILRWSASEVSGHENLLRLVFYNDRFITAFFKGGQLQLLQTFSYHTPEDVAYQLLLICRQFGLAQQELNLKLSGLIDSQSALYTELLKYFSQVSYEGIPDGIETGDLLQEFPTHYFSPLLKFSLCV